MIQARDNAYSLLELTQYIKRLLALNFPDAVWVRAEISQSTLRRGHRYVQLIQKEEGDSQEIVAQLNAVVWGGDFIAIESRLGDEAEKILAQGIQVLVRGIISFHERYGLQFRIFDLDENYTRGALDLQLEQLIRQLELEGLTELNKALPFPTVLRKIAVISSSKAAGWEDFKKIIYSNPYNLYFDITLFECSMQGEKVQGEVLAAMDKINADTTGYDVIAIIRGGGSKIDLAAFNDYLMCKKISESKLPVLTGIGHEIDKSAVDFVSAMNFNTPTALAAWLIDYNWAKWNEIHDLRLQINDLVSQIILNHKNQLHLQKIRILHQISLLRQNLVHNNSLMYQKIKNAISNQIERKKQMLSRLNLKIESFNPAFILQQGYAMIIQDNKQIKTLARLNDSLQFTIRMSDGERNALIIKEDNKSETEF